MMLKFKLTLVMLMTVYACNIMQINCTSGHRTGS